MGAAVSCAHLPAFAAAGGERFGGILRGWPDVRLPFPGWAGFVFRQEPPAHFRAFAAARGAARAGMMAERLGAFKIMEFP